MALADINVRIGATIQGLKQGLSKAEKALMKSASRMEKIGSDLSAKISLPLIGIGGAAIKAAGDFQKLENGLKAVIGDADKARMELENLQVAAQNPGLSFEQAVKGSIRLQAVEFNAAQARETMLEFGNAIAIAGGTAEDLDAVTQQITQMVSKNRILQEDFGVLQERVPLISKALEGAFGTKNIENIRATGISAQEFVGKIVTELSTLERVDGGINNAFVNLQNSAKAALATIGAEINNAVNLQKILADIAAVLGRVASSFKALSPETKKFIVIAAGIAAALGPVLVGIGAMLKLLPLMKAGLLALTSPFGLIVAGVSALAAGFIYARNKSEGFRRSTNAIGAAFLELVKIIKEVVSQFGQGLRKIYEGDVKGGLADLGTAIVKGNPIGLAIFEGKRLGKAFTDGYAAQIEEEVPKAVKAVVPKVNTADIFKGFGAGQTSAGAGGSSSNTFTPTEIPLLKPLQTLPKQVESIAPALESIKVPIREVTTSVETMAEKFQKVNEQLEQLQEGKGGLGTMGEVLGAAASSMLSLAQSGEASFKRLGQAALKGAAQVARAKIIEATVAFAADAFTKLGIFGTVLAAGAGALVGGVFNGLISKIGIPALAEGGIVNRPTLALIGEAGPEAVVPLSKYNGGGNMVAEARISGKDLLILVRQAENDINRIGI